MSNNVVFVPACLLDPSFQAEKKRSDCDWQDRVLSFFSENSYVLVPMPCPEYSFFCKMDVINRKPHGIDYYEKLSGFRNYCKECAKETVQSIKKTIYANNNVVAVIGIEHSPSCATRYMYTHAGMKKRKGIFFTELEYELGLMNIPMLGINRNYPEKFIRTFNQEINNK